MTGQSTPDPKGEPREVTVPAHLAGIRFDQALAELFPEFSRAQLQRWIHSGHATVGGSTRRPRDKVKGGEHVALVPGRIRGTPWQAQPLDLDIVYEDDHLIVINKTAGLVVHPGAGNRDGTLVNALLHHDPRLADIPRAGVVHRLDKDTTGLLVAARSLEAHNALVEQLKRHRIERVYDAVVRGRITAGGRVDAPIGRHPTQRTRMAVVASGRSAVTHYRVVARYRQHSRVRATLETGRTHQIRVHMAHIRHPVVGDPTYGGRLAIPAGATPELEARLRTFERQALHARRLALTHPYSGEPVEWTAPLPLDLAALIDALEADAAAVGQPPGTDVSSGA